MQALEVPKIVVYSDVNVDVLTSSPFELVFNDEDVKKSLQAIFLTPYSSCPFRRRFGTKIADLLYEPITEETAIKIRTMLLETSKLWEPRIDKITVVVLADVENQQYYVDMRYTIIGLNDKMVNYRFNVSK